MHHISIIRFDDDGTEEEEESLSHLTWLMGSDVRALQTLQVCNANEAICNARSDQSQRQRLLILSDDGMPNLLIECALEAEDGRDGRECSCTAAPGAAPHLCQKLAAPVVSTSPPPQL